MNKKRIIITNIIILIISINLFANKLESSYFLDDKLVSFSNRALVNEELSITVNIENLKKDSELFWTILSSSSKSKPNLSYSNQNKTITFVPKVKGVYILKLTYKTNNQISTKTIEFNVKENHPFSFENITPPNNIENNIGIIENQSWVSSKVFNQKQLKQIVSKYDKLNIINYSEIYGVLIEYDKNSFEVKEQINKLKQEYGIDDVYNRVYEGKNAFEIYEVSPN